LQFLVDGRWIGGVEGGQSRQDRRQIAEGQIRIAIGGDLVIDGRGTGPIARAQLEPGLLKLRQDTVAAAAIGDIGHGRRGGGDVAFIDQFHGQSEGPAIGRALALAVILPADDGRGHHHRRHRKGDDVFAVTTP
jgi:hypothetical protein